MRVCILTRGDLFPTQHGAAVKIVRTAEHLSALDVTTCIVTDDRDHYLRFGPAGVEQIPYPPRVRAAQEWPPLPRLAALSERLCDAVGYPRAEHFLYRPIFDPAWWLRAAAVGHIEDIDWFQAEFPGYGAPALVAARSLSVLRRLLGRRGAGGRRPAKASIVQHNVEWARLAELGHDTRRARRVEQALLALVDEVIAVSEADRRRMTDAGAPPDAITVIPHGVDAEAFATAIDPGIRARHGLPPDTPILFFHGTLHYWPNTEAVRFIAEQLLPRLLERRPELRVVIAGMSPPTYYAHPAIVFTGPVDDLAEHIAAADVCICPLFAGGGTRLKLLEYMAGGKPIVSTTKGAEGIAIQPGVHLELADDADAMADRILALLDDPPRRAALGVAAQRFARRLDWREVTGAYVDLYTGRHRGADWYRRLLAGERPSALSATPSGPGRAPPSAPGTAPPPTPTATPSSAPGGARVARPAATAPAGRGVEIEAHLPPRRPGKPLTLLLLINRGCNLRCSFCDLWQEHIHMPVRQRVLPLLDDAAAIGTKTLVITGGEPFLHPDLFDAVTAARARGMTVNITTNGTRLHRRWQECIDSGVDSLSLSIDGLERTHDRLRGQVGAWRKTMAALDRITADGRMQASVYFTATSDNVHELVEVWALVRQRGARFDFWPVNDAPQLYLKTPEQRAAWRAAVDRICAEDAEIAARRPFYEGALAYHRGELDQVPLRCLGLVDQYGVTYDGRLLPCCVWGAADLAVGNVFETPLRTLWYRPDVQAARRRLWGEGCTAGCFNHSLYELQGSTGRDFRVRVDGAAAG